MMLYRNFARAAPSGDRWWHKGTSLSQFEVSAAHCGELDDLGDFSQESGKKIHGSKERYGKFNLLGPASTSN
jgi:hypothetical protein